MLPRASYRNNVVVMNHAHLRDPVESGMLFRRQGQMTTYHMLIQQQFSAEHFQMINLSTGLSHDQPVSLDATVGDLDNLGYVRIYTVTIHDEKNRSDSQK